MLDRILSRLEEWIIATLIGAATVLTFVAVVHRYGASNSAGLARWAGIGGDVRRDVAAQTKLFAHVVRFPRSRMPVAAAVIDPKSSKTEGEAEIRPRSAGNPEAICVAIGSALPAPVGV